MKLLRIWAPDPHAAGFREEACRQAAVLHGAPEEIEALDFIEAAADWTPPARKAGRNRHRHGQWRLRQVPSRPGHPSDFLGETDRVPVCLLTTTLREATLHRCSVPADTETGLREPSQIMVDKVMAVRRDRCGTPIGRVDAAALIALGAYWPLPSVLQIETARTANDRDVPNV